MKNRSCVSATILTVAVVGAISRSASAQPKFHHLHGGEVNGIFFLNNTLGWTAEDGTRVRYTSNGGQTWDYALVNTDNLDVRVPLLNVYFFDQFNGWAVGGEGVVLKSTDGGQTWTDANQFDRIYSNSTAMGACGTERAELFDIFMTTLSIGFVVGDDGVIQKTIDGGSTWNPIANLPTAFQCGSDPDDGYSIHFFQNSGSGAAAYSKGIIAADKNRVWLTSDGGGSWMPVALPGTGTGANCPKFDPNNPADNVEVWDIDFEDPTTYNSPGWAGGGIGFAKGYLYRTLDGGATWTQSYCTQYLLPYPEYLGDMACGLTTIYGVAALGASDPRGFRRIRIGTIRLSSGGCELESVFDSVRHAHLTRVMCRCVDMGAEVHGLIKSRTVYR